MRMYFSIDDVNKWYKVRVGHLKIMSLLFLSKLQCNAACIRHNNCCHDYKIICIDNNGVSDDDLITISNYLFDLAIEKQVGIVLNLQGHV